MRVREIWGQSAPQPTPWIILTELNTNKTITVPNGFLLFCFGVGGVVGGGHGFLRLYGHKEIFTDVYIYQTGRVSWTTTVAKNTRLTASVWLLPATAAREKVVWLGFFFHTYWLYDHELISYIKAPNYVRNYFLSFFSHLLKKLTLDDHAGWVTLIFLARRFPFPCGHVPTKQHGCMFSPPTLILELVWTAHKANSVLLSSQTNPSTPALCSGSHLSFPPSARTSFLLRRRGTFPPVY